MTLTMPPFQQRISHPSMNKSTFVELWDPVPRAKGPGEESCPSVHLVIGRQTLAWAMKPVNLSQPLLPWSGKYLETADLGRYRLTREKSQKISLPKGRRLHTTGAIKLNEFGSSGEERTLPALSQPLATLRGAKLSGSSNLSPRRKGEW